MSKKADYFQSLYEVVRVINSSLDPTIVLEKITEQVATAMSCKGCTIRLLDKNKQTLLASGSYGLSKGYLRKGPVEVSKSALDREILAGNFVYMKNVANDTRFQYPEQAKAEGICSILSAPLMVDGKAIGVLRIYSASEREFGDDERDFLFAMANISAIAIENARLHQALKSDYELLTKYNYQVFED